MIFFLRIIVFSFFIILGFHISVRSIKGRAVVSGIYALVLVWYTFLCRVHLTVDVAASDYGHKAVTMSTGEKIWQLLKSIFGMDPSGLLAGVYWQAFILNSYLFIPLGFLVYLHFLCGDSSVLGSTVGRETRDVITEESRTLAKSAAKSILVCVATSLVIEVTQEITYLGMFDINDILANSIGSGIGIGMVWFWQQFRRS